MYFLLGHHSSGNMLPPNVWRTNSTVGQTYMFDSISTQFHSSRSCRHSLAALQQSKGAVHCSAFQLKWIAVALRFTACYSFRCNLSWHVSDMSPVFRIHTQPCSEGVTAPDTIRKSLNPWVPSLGRVEHILIY